MSPVATLRFTLPAEQGDYDAARLGSQALLTLWEIDQKCRSLLGHGNPTPETARLAEEIRGMIDGELLEA
jgi:dihydrodipicolinate synthase/N-acetylneuraminate lyase